MAIPEMIPWLALVVGTIWVLVFASSMIVMRASVLLRRARTYSAWKSILKKQEVSSLENLVRGKLTAEAKVGALTKEVKDAQQRLLNIQKQQETRDTIAPNNEALKNNNKQLHDALTWMKSILEPHLVEVKQEAPPAIDPFAASVKEMARRLTVLSDATGLSITERDFASRVAELRETIGTATGTTQTLTDVQLELTQFRDVVAQHVKKPITPESVGNAFSHLKNELAEAKNKLAEAMKDAKKQKKTLDSLKTAFEDVSAAFTELNGLPGFSRDPKKTLEEWADAGEFPTSRRLDRMKQVRRTLIAGPDDRSKGGFEWTGHLFKSSSDGTWKYKLELVLLPNTKRADLPGSVFDWFGLEGNPSALYVGSSEPAELTEDAKSVVRQFSLSKDGLSLSLTLDQAGIVRLVGARKELVDGD